MTLHYKVAKQWYTRHNKPHCGEVSESESQGVLDRHWAAAIYKELSKLKYSVLCGYFVISESLKSHHDVIYIYGGRDYGVPCDEAYTSHHIWR